MEMKFSRLQYGGYDPGEVDTYIAKISQNYTRIYETYTGQQGQIQRLTQEVQTAKDVNARLAAEIERLRKSAVCQIPIDTNVIAKLMLDAELFAKRIKDESVAEAEKRLTETQTQVNVLEVRRETILESIKQLARDLTALSC